MKTMMNLIFALRRLYWWIFRPKTRGVRAIAIDQDGKVLLVRHSYGSGWYLPGGRVKRKEEDERALRRELHEETGVSIGTDMKVLGQYRNEREHKKDTIIVFIVDVISGSKSSDVEIRDRGFFSLDALPEDISPGTKRRIEEWQQKRIQTTDW